MAGIRNDTHRRRFKKTCFGPEYSSDNAGDGPEGKDSPNKVPPTPIGQAMVEETTVTLRLTGIDSLVPRALRLLTKTKQMGKDQACVRLIKLVQQNAVFRGEVSLKNLGRVRNPIPKPNLCGLPMTDNVGGFLKAESGVGMPPMGLGEGSSGLTHPSVGEKFPGLPSLGVDEGGGCPTPHGAAHTGVVKVPLYTLQQMIDEALASGTGHVSPLFTAGGFGQVPSLSGAGRAGHVPSPTAAGGADHKIKSGADHAGDGKIPIYTLEQMIRDAALVSDTKLAKEGKRDTKYGNYCWCDDREYDRDPSTHILKVEWTIPMLAKLSPHMTA